MARPIIFVNSIDVEPAKQQEVVDLLTEGAERVISKRPGFISLSILASPDKRRVVNIARWETLDDAKSTQTDPAAAEYARRIAAIADPTPGVYSIVSELKG